METFPYLCKPRLLNECSPCSSILCCHSPNVGVQKARSSRMALTLNTILDYSVGDISVDYRIYIRGNVFLLAAPTCIDFLITDNHNMPVHIM